MPRVLAIALLLAASAALTLARLDRFGGEADVAAAPLAAAPARGPFYDPAPPVAGEISAARRRFIARADRTCVRTSKRGRAEQAAYARHVTGRPDARELVTRFYVRRQTGQYRALRALGKPPEGRLAYRHWLDNFGARVRLEATYLPLMSAGRAAEAESVVEQVSALKARGNLLGRRFGLQRCTADGPG